MAGAWLRSRSVSGQVALFWSVICRHSAEASNNVVTVALAFWSKKVSSRYIWNSIQWLTTLMRLRRISAYPHEKFAEGEAWKNFMAEQTMHEELEEAVSMSKVREAFSRQTYEANPNAATVPAPSNGDLAGVHGCGIPMEWRLEGRLPRPGLILRGAKTLGPHGTIPAHFAKFSRPACRSVILLPV